MIKAFLFAILMSGQAVLLPNDTKFKTVEDCKAFLAHPPVLPAGVRILERNHGQKVVFGRGACVTPAGAAKLKALVRKHNRENGHKSQQFKGEQDA
jgi:hypothetical protein